MSRKTVTKEKSVVSQEDQVMTILIKNYEVKKKEENIYMDELFTITCI